jgi:hypothetical protein
MPVAVVRDPAHHIAVVRHLATHAGRYILTLPRTSSIGWLHQPDHQDTINRPSATNRKVDGLWWKHRTLPKESGRRRSLGAAAQIRVSDGDEEPIEF